MGRMIHTLPKLETGDKKGQHASFTKPEPTALTRNRLHSYRELYCAIYE